MASSSSKDYVFTRDYLDNNRINLQHSLSVQLFGYHIHQSIPTPTGNSSIADVGTGTGKLPSSARLDGLDIFLDAAPLPELLPQNVNLRLWNIKDDVPEDLVGVYDVVHVRFFAFVLQQPDLENVIDNLAKLLKPGGYLQWTDMDVSSIRLEKIKPDIEADAQLTLMKLFQGNEDRLQPAWVPELPELLTRKGFADVESDAKECQPYLALAFHECGLLATEVLARNKEGEKDGVGLLKQVLDQAAKETRHGSNLAFTRYTFIGRKQ
ncbi:uncharacterized protein N7483_012363 [Penicillium malachiteum]|uniref:uncharacterized protein n=1 Tax=Penicillium malachiteum TaxID=1324776 RepID=UPI002547BC5E|nr:uncharacterized protein N7483_012363 [Penicillium malachiteum]KAJ5715182.1 hypothetical protein N7483_012363 [Penicillium malachiteum]